MRPECFGREYIDAKKEECPFTECLIREECKQVFSAARGLVSLRKSESKIKKFASTPQRFERVVKKKRAGYVKPGRLLYKDEGTVRDKLLFEIRDYLGQKSYKCKATKCLHSFIDSNKEFLLKIDTRRRNSILLYIRDDFSQYVDERGFKCRGLYNSEVPNFPGYLCWVMRIRDSSGIGRFIDAFEEYLEDVNHDSE